MDQFYKFRQEGEKMMKLLFATALLLMFANLSWAVPTTVTVRAKSKDAKFIGSSMGGASVVIRDAKTGEILAQGLTAGGTGDGQKIMVDPVKRGVPISDMSAAKFEAVLDISEPKFVTIEVSGPMGQKQSIAKSTTQVWILPGRNIEGDGLVIEVPGFSVSLLSPQAQGTYRLSGGAVTVPVKANIVMM
jgi:hypothetical protein